MVPADLTELRRLYMGFMGARVVITANRLRVFDHLREASTAEEAAKALNADSRAMEILLDALAGVGLVKKDKAGRYRNAPVSSRYLIEGKRNYQGDIIRHAASMWENFSALDDVVRTGLPARHGRHEGLQHEAFIMGMHNLSVLRARDLVDAIGLKGVKTMLDLGGGPGTNAITISKKGVRATVFDLPETVEIARKVALREKAGGIVFISGDFHSDSIGSGYDLILVSQILHAFSGEENLSLLRKCKKALNPGGRVVVQEFPIDKSRTAPPQSALFSVNMLVGTVNGRCYTNREMKGWLTETGFRKIAVKRLPETVLIEGVAV